MNRIAALAITLTLFTCFFAATAPAYDDVTPSTAYSLAGSDPNVFLLDVRTAAEWQWVGHPGANKLGEGSALAGKVVNVSYQIEHKGSMVLNPSFLSDINEIFGDNPNVRLIVYCRSGNRSVPAATLLEAAGYQVLNMPAGFEGGTDAKGYRTKNGWKIDGLPYTYAGAGYKD